MYCNGLDEHYIDLACPFGKTNSTLEFCPPVKLFAMSVVANWSSVLGGPRPVLSSYVDDFYGGIPDCDSYETSLNLRDHLCKTGAKLTFEFNMKPHKTPLPAKRQCILGRMYDSTVRRITTEEAKRKKYLERIQSISRERFTTRKAIEELHGCLNYVADIKPFGRPFLAHLTTAMSGVKPNENIVLPTQAKMGLRIWSRILTRNKGASFDFVSNRIPRAGYDIFVDASTSWGIGGCCGRFYFAIP